MVVSVGLMQQHAVTSLTSGAVVGIGAEGKGCRRGFLQQEVLTWPGLRSSSAGSLVEARRASSSFAESASSPGFGTRRRRKGAVCLAFMDGAVVAPGTREQVQWGRPSEAFEKLKRLPIPENRADDKNLMNPLQRLERFGPGWFGAILDWEGVIVEEDSIIERDVWESLAEEEGKRLPAAWLLRRAEGMKTEQVVSEVLCWARDPMQVRRIARRKESLVEEKIGGRYKLVPGVRNFLEMLKKYNTPVAVGSTKPRLQVDKVLQDLELEQFIDVVIAADDVHRGKPDPEMYLYAAQAIGRIPERCLVFGSANACIEAAHEGGMKCIAVANKHPAHELRAADSVVRRLDELDMRGLKLIVSQEEPSPMLELEEEFEVEEQLKPTAFADDW